MANYANLEAAIQATIYNNGQNLITGSALQGILLDMVDELGKAGSVFGGVVDRDYVPQTSDSNIFYIAGVPGTYSGFNQTVSVGEFAIFYFDGTSWAKTSVTSAEVAVTLNGQTGVTLATISVGGQNYQIKAEKKDITPTVGSSYPVTSNGVAAAIASAVNNINNALALKADKTYVDNGLATKADKVAGAVNGNMAALDASGNIVDSGISSSAVGDVANKIDKVPTAEQGNVAMFDSDGGIEDSEVPADKIAQQDGYYSTLIAGAAENLVGQDIQTAQFTRRVSGGSADVGTGAAVIKSIKGNTLVWNQQVRNGDMSDGTNGWLVGSCTLSASDGILSMTVGANVGDGDMMYQSIAPYVSGHKYYLRQEVMSPRATTLQWGLLYYLYGFNVPANQWVTLSQIISVTGTYTVWRYGPAGRLGETFQANDVVKFKNMLMIDLTEMFGSGNEPTVADFESLFPLNYYANVTPFLLNNKVTSLVTTGFNQWDEEWENGFYSTTSGNKSSYATSQIRTRNYIAVMPSTTYYVKTPIGSNMGVFVLQYDADKNYLGIYNWEQNYTFTTNSDCRFLTFYTHTTYGDTYHNDICINKNDTDKNGTYEPYEKHTLQMPLTTMTSGGTAIFPDGMKSAGTAYDETDGVKAVKRIGVVDMGTLTWGSPDYSNTHWRATTTGLQSVIAKPSANNVVGNVKTVKYLADTSNNTYSHTKDNIISIDAGNGSVFIYSADFENNNYTGAQIQSALSGVYLYYELATPVEYTLDTSLGMQYYVNNDGTEEITPENGSTPTTAPMLMDVQYAMNAVDTLRNLPKNYISKASMDAILTAFKTAGVITAYTLTWDSTNQKYNCTITV